MTTSISTTHDEVFEDGSRLGIENEWFLHNEVNGHRYAKNVAEAIGGSPEMFDTQYEQQTPPTAIHDVEVAIRKMRQQGSHSAANVGALIVATGTCLLDPPEGHLFRNNPRGLMYAEVLRSQASELVTVGTHVHVTVNDPDKKVAVANRIRPWLDVLTAIGSSSVVWNRRVTGYSSWRTQIWKQFDGCVLDYPYFPDWESWAKFVEREIHLLQFPPGDMTMFHPWAVRPHAKLPTVEVRCIDIGLTPEDDALAAYLVHGLVLTALAEIDAKKPQQYEPPWRSFYGAARRVASLGYLRYGPEKKLLHPATLELTDASVVINELVAYISPALRDAGTWERVLDLKDQIMHFGSGSDRIINTCNAINAAHDLESLDTWHAGGSGFFPTRAMLTSEVTDQVIAWAADQTVNGGINNSQKAKDFAQMS